MRASEETLAHQSLTDRTEILDSVRRQVRIPKRVDYDHVAYCCRCAETFQKDLLRCPNCGLLLRHSPRSSANNRDVFRY
jgi:rRNA maturation endonuclease Nob1